MALDPVPTWIHGAKHSGDILRQGTFNQTGGAEGVSSPTAFRVRATQTPSNKVRVDPGGLLMLSPWDEGQTYSMRNASETLVEVPESSSLSANTWYINAWVNDPLKPGGTVPVSKEFGPYNFLTCDAEPKDNNPAYACAKIVVPKSIATVESDMIEDLREVANPIVGQFTFSRERISEDSDRQIKLTRPFTDDGVGPFYGELFPGGDGIPNQTRQKIPARATHMALNADWMAISVKGGQNSWGRYWIEFGDEYREHTWASGRQYEFSTSQFGFDTSDAETNYKESWPLKQMVYIPSKLRGKMVTFVFKAGLDAGASASGIEMAGLGGLALQAVFSMSPVDADTV
ncbi:MAG: hypothetical protein L0L38_08000 [Bifidobacterium mongoliense]|nr:hypothetical protein [Bifidobacterium mongoliense]MDN6720558.1 hypothetical protein [Bifidobacterium mongoliense]